MQAAISMDGGDGKRIGPLGSNSSLGQDQRLGRLPTWQRSMAPSLSSYWPISYSVRMTKPTMFEKVKVAEGDILGEGVQQQKEQWTF